MDEKTTGIISYLSLIGWIVALAVRKEKTEYTSFHLRQMLGIMVLYFALMVFGIALSVVSSSLGKLASFFYIIPVVLWVLGFVGAINNEKKLVPVVGEKFQEWFQFL